MKRRRKPSGVSTYIYKLSIENPGESMWSMRHSLCVLNDVSCHDRNMCGRTRPGWSKFLTSTTFSLSIDYTQYLYMLCIRFLSSRVVLRPEENFTRLFRCIHCSIASMRRFLPVAVNVANKCQSALKRTAFGIYRRQECAANGRGAY